MKLVLASLLLFSICDGQEASSGLQIEGTLSVAGEFANKLTEVPRDGSPLAGGVRLLLYPVWRINNRWSVAAAVQIHSRPYFFEEFQTQGYGMKADILQARLTYSRTFQNRSVTVQLGQMQSAFGSFLLRYDDNRNPLIGMPISYGYYEAGVTDLGLMGAQLDSTLGRFDFRAQFVNSSPGNRRSVFDKDQYGNWAGGVGYTVIQGLRVGVSAYRGPYLDRQSEYFTPGEARPRSLPGSAYGAELEAGHGPWNLYAEVQRFQFTYRAIPTFTEQAAYAELRRTLAPRWYAAARINGLNTVYKVRQIVYEGALGFRLNRNQLVKIEYEKQTGTGIPASQGNIIAVQLVTSLRPLSLTRN